MIRLTILFLLLKFTLVNAQNQTNSSPKGKPKTILFEHELNTNKTDIPYTVASNYFIRKTAKASALKKTKIINLKDFNEIFGPINSLNANPTPINFNNVYVISVIENKTKMEQEIILNEVFKENSEINVNYKVKTKYPAENANYAFKILLIDKKYAGIVKLNKVN